MTRKQAHEAKFELVIPEQEWIKLSECAQKANLSQSGLIRMLLNGKCPHASPSKPYLQMIRNLSGAHSSIQQFRILIQNQRILYQEINHQKDLIPDSRNRTAFLIQLDQWDEALLKLKSDFNETINLLEKTFIVPVRFQKPRELSEEDKTALKNSSRRFHTTVRMSAAERTALDRHAARFGNYKTAPWIRTLIRSFEMPKEPDLSNGNLVDLSFQCSSMLNQIYEDLLQDHRLDQAVAGRTAILRDKILENKLCNLSAHQERLEELTEKAGKLFSEIREICSETNKEVFISQFPE